MSERRTAAFWGGLFIGVLSALPLVASLNACCCLWVITGGVLSTYLMQANIARPVVASEGAVAGALAGALGAVVSTIIAGAIDLARGRAPAGVVDELLESGVNFPPEFVALLERVRELPAAFWYLAPLVLALFVFPIFGMLGGLLGVAIFRKSAPPPPPPPPGTIEELPPQ